MINTFQQAGKFSVRSDWLKREQKGTDSSTANPRRLRLLTPSGPAALPIGRDLRTVSTSDGVSCKELKSESHGD